jgi:hypothetical protein
MPVTQHNEVCWQADNLTPTSCRPVEPSSRNAEAVESENLIFKRHRLLHFRRLA